MNYWYKNIYQKYLFLCKYPFWWCLIAIGILLKMVCFPHEYADYYNFLEPWIDFIRTHGYFSALQYDFSNYAPSYLYILVFIAKLGLNPLYSIKIVSIAFEYLLAYFVGKIIFLKYPDRLYIWISLAIVPLIPSVFVNSAYWAQCDAIYSAFAVGSVYFLLKKEAWLSALFFGISLAFKMQICLLLPFFFVMLLRRQIQWYHFLLVPVVYIVSVLPAYVAGRDLWELLTVYLSQSDQYKELTMNFPNLYIWLNNDYYEPVKMAGLALTVILTLVTGFVLSRKNLEFTFENAIQLVFLSAAITPFFLPGMHERYMYLGDVLGVAYFFVLRRNIGFALGIMAVSFYSYTRCSSLHDAIPIAPAFFLYVALLVLMLLNFKKSLKYA